MASAYVQPTEGEFDAFITDVVPSAEKIGVEGTKETVYELPLPDDDLTIRVYSTLDGGAARGCGEDAIRTVVHSDRVGHSVGGRRKTLRIETWRKNLREKIEDLYANWRDHDHGECPSCGRGLLVEHDGEHGEFLGCSEYPACDHTEGL